MIRSGELKNWAEAARLIGITRTRMTQTANLMLLAPEIQEAILNRPRLAMSEKIISEHDLRPLLDHINWNHQEQEWSNLPSNTEQLNSMLRRRAPTSVGQSTVTITRRFSDAELRALQQFTDLCLITRE